MQNNRYRYIVVGLVLWVAINVSWSGCFCFLVWLFLFLGVAVVDSWGGCCCFLGSLLLFLGAVVSVS